MARGTPTHEPPEFPDDELLPEEAAALGARQLLRMFLPVAAAIVVFIGALLLVLKFLVIPAMERSDPSVQARALATIGALQTAEVVTQAQQALTPQPTPLPTSTPRPVQAVQPASQATAPSTTVAISAGVAPVEASTPVAPPAAATAPAGQGSTASPAQLSTDTGDVPAEVDAPGEAAPGQTEDPVAAAEVQQAYAITGHNARWRFAIWTQYDS